MKTLKTIVLVTLGMAALAGIAGCEEGERKPEAKLIVTPVRVEENFAEGKGAISMYVEPQDGQPQLVVGYRDGYYEEAMDLSSAKLLIDKKIAEQDTMTVTGHFENRYGGRIIRMMSFDLYGYHFKFDK
ncbi:MAG: hypothetical protein V1725_06770 [archaeon]